MFYRFYGKIRSYYKSKKHSKIEKNKWLYSNSSHVFDLLFFLCGHPKKIKSYVRGKNTWHPKASSFAGAGITNKNIIFSYFADWESGGRWNIDLRTNKKKYILDQMKYII